MPPKKKGKALSDFVKLYGDQTEWRTASEIPRKELQEAYNFEASFSSVETCLDKAKKLAGQEPVQTAGARTTIAKCTESLCSDRTRCLNHLGQTLWLDDDKAFKAFGKIRKLGSDPNEEIRDSETPVGLKNLGATCYANSYLQCWFQNIDFRAAVFRCPIIATGSNVKIEDIPLFQLQVTFAALQDGPMSSYNPKPLIKSLKLEEGEQQDATEFGKLFMGLLDHGFKRQSDPSLQAVIPNLFEGKKVYGTRCETCKYANESITPFLELEIPLKAGCLLVTQLAKSMLDETLSGDNQYMCSRCDELVDATRFSRIENLPPILHFSLLRFVFDEKTFDRKKTNAAIKYPPVLDMTPFLPELADREPVLYDLKGVLLHKGTSAHHGHYVAQIYDEKRGKWFLCDDESVWEASIIKKPKTKGKARSDDKVRAGGDGVIDLTEADFEEDEVEETPPVPANPNALASSRDAYMLVYTRRTQDSKSQQVEPTPSKAVQDHLSQLCVDFETAVHEYDEKSQQVKAEFEKAREERRSVWSKWTVFEDDEPSVLVSKSALASWLEEGVKPLPKNKAEKSKEPGKADGARSQDAKATEDANSDIKILNKAEANGNGHVDTAPNGTVAAKENGTLANLAAEDEIPIATEGKIQIISNAAIICLHGRLDPSKVDECKQISQLGAMALDELGVKIEPRLTSDDAFCRDCIWSCLRANYYTAQHIKAVKEYKKHKVVKSGPAPRYWISKPWLADWTNESPDMHIAALGLDPPPDSDEWQLHTTCLHGRLVPSLKQRTGISDGAFAVFQELFPTWVPFAYDEPKCEECLGGQDVLYGEELRKQSGVEKKSILKDLNNTTSRMNQWQLMPDTNHYAVPEEWVRNWKAWIKNPVFTDRPSTIELATHFCVHHYLHTDLISKTSFYDWVLVSEPEWKQLRVWYDCDVEDGICINIDDSLSQRTSFPQFCQSCHDDKARDYEEATVRIVQLQPADFDAKGYKRPYAQRIELSSQRQDREDSPGPIGLADKKKMKTYGQRQAPAGTRFSSRVKGKKPGNPRKEQAFIIQRFDTVKDLKLQIQTEWRVSPIYQTLYFEDRELASMETMSGAGIIQDSVLELAIADPPDEKKALAAGLENAEEHRHKRARTDRQEGFGTTGLHGLVSIRAPSEELNSIHRYDSEVSEMDDAASNGGSINADGDIDMLAPDGPTCLTCTFLNTFAAEKCEICETPLVSGQTPAVTRQ